MSDSKRTYIHVVCALVLFVALVGFAVYSYTSPTGISARRSADIIELSKSESASYTTLDGNPIELLQSKDTILIVTVWASWSPYTVSDFVSLSILKETYGDQIHIVALNRMEPKETAEAFLNTIKKPEGVEQILDTNDYFFETIGGYAMPETLLFDRIGNIQFHKRGVLNVEEFKAKIQDLLNT